MKARVHVTLKQGVLDPQGQAVANGLEALGYEEVQDVRVGKFFDLELEDGLHPAEARERVARMCEQLLANTVIEDYEIELEAD